jgi:hypothetical protein
MRGTKRDGTIFILFKHMMPVYTEDTEAPLPSHQCHEPVRPSSATKGTSLPTEWLPQVHESEGGFQTQVDEA